MKIILKRISVIVIGILFLAGCSVNTSSGNKFVDVFEKNEQLFDDVAQYICEFDYTPYEKEIAQDEAIYGSFAVSDFEKQHKYIMVIEAGAFSASTFYEEVPIPPEVQNIVQKIFDLRYAFICQVNARDEGQIVYFRVDDVEGEGDRPHGIAYSQSGNRPENLGNDRKITVMEPISENWYYYEQESYAEYETENK